MNKLPFTETTINKTRFVDFTVVSNSLIDNMQSKISVELHDHRIELNVFGSPNHFQIFWSGVLVCVVLKNRIQEANYQLLNWIFPT